jgi:flagellar basal-body rod protein FlgB
MKVFGLNSAGIEAASRSLDFVSLSTLFTAENIANSNTPGYKTKQINFEDAMAEALRSGGKKGGAATSMTKTDPRHFPLADLSKVKPLVIMNRSGGGIDGNNVDMDKEITRLGELDVKYSAYSAIVGKEMGKLKRAIDMEP